MKLKKHVFSALFFIAILTSFSSIAQTKHTITLNVDTGMITKQTVSRYANFGQARSITNENYTTDVRLGDYVEWIGVSTRSENDDVEIISINHVGGARVFGKNVLNGSNGIVIDKVVAGRAGDYEKYTVKFHVYVNGVQKSGVFIIDPKIVIRSSEQ